jgi:hypothetical protein
LANSKTASNYCSIVIQRPRHQAPDPRLRTMPLCVGPSLFLPLSPPLIRQNECGGKNGHLEIQKRSHFDAMGAWSHFSSESGCGVLGITRPSAKNPSVAREGRFTFAPCRLQVSELRKARRMKPCYRRHIAEILARLRYVNQRDAEFSPSSVQSMLEWLALDEGTNYERAFRNCISTDFDGLLRSGLRSARRYG